MHFFVYRAVHVDPYADNRTIAISAAMHAMRQDSSSSAAANSAGPSGWSVQDWVDLINADGTEFRSSWGGQIGPNARPFLIAYAYLLGKFTAFERLGRFMRPSLARRVFAAGPVDAAVEQLCTVLAAWGYRRDAQKLEPVVCQVLLLNRSPRLEDLSTETLGELRESPAMGGQWGKDLHGVHRAVAALGHTDPPRLGPEARPAAMEGVPSGWAGWIERRYAPRR